MMAADESPVDTELDWDANDFDVDSMNPAMSHGLIPPPPDYHSGCDTSLLSEEPPALSPIDQSDDGRPRWQCAVCNSQKWRWMAGGYRCEDCGHDRFYDANQSTGRWVFVPHGSPIPHLGDSLAGNDQKLGDPGPSRPPSSAGGGERQAESELATTDPSVDPDTMFPMSRRQRRAARRLDATGCGVKTGVGHNDNNQQSGLGAINNGLSLGGQQQLDRQTSGGNQWRDDMLKGLNTLATKKKDDDWNLKKGPSPGVKYRGGTPPAPPSWSYAKDDLRAFQKWERKVEIWKIQVATYLPPNEAAMLLYCSLKGEAEEELEWCDVKMINNDNGVQYIIDSLRQPLMTRAVYLKRRYLHEFEYIQRGANETIRAFCNRYNRVERSLHSVGIDVQGMYDSESRGSRLLERLRLGLDQQRLILVASGQSLQFDVIREAAQIQFPEHRPTPAVVYSREFDNPGRSESSQASRPSQPYQRPLDKGHSKGKGKGNSKTSHGSGPSKTYVTEVSNEQPQDQEDDDEPQQEADDAEPLDDADEVGETADDDQSNTLEEDLAEVARCLTVTARRLQGITLGRKFSGPPKSLQQRKAESHCAVCGERGHWKGDPECKQSGGTDSGTGKGGSKQKGSNDRKQQSGGKKVFQVSHPGGYHREVAFNDTPEYDKSNPSDETYGKAFTSFMVWVPDFKINQVYGNTANSFNHYLILDTACQKTCCSTSWLTSWENHVMKFNIYPKTFPCREPFEFGHGPTQYSEQHALLFSCFDGTPETTCIIGASVLPTTNDIPLLGSNQLLREALGAIINLPENQAHLTKLGCTVPILMLNGHLALDISAFPSHVDQTMQWKFVHEHADLKSIDEFATVENLMATREPSLKSAAPDLHDQPDFSNSIAATADASSTQMASALATLRGSSVPCRDPASTSDDPSMPSRSSTSNVAAASGSNEHGTDASSVGQGNRPMRAPEVQSVWKPPRQVQSVPAVRKEMAMERRSSKVGRTSSIAKAAAAAAFTILVNSCALQGQAVPAQVLPGTCSGSTMPPSGFHARAEEFIETFEGIEDPIGFSQEKPGRESGGVRGRRGDGGLRLGPGPRRAQSGLKKGAQTWLTGHLKAQQKIYENEMKIMDNIPCYRTLHLEGPHTDVLTLDLMEIFAGRGRVSELAPRFGLRAVQPIDMKYGHNLHAPEVRDMVLRAVYNLKPLLLMIEWPCKQLRDEDRPLVRFGVELCRLQDEGRRLYLGENPLRSRIWDEPEVQSLRDDPDCLQVECEAGAYGAEDSEGFPIVKPHRWITNSESIAARLGEKMTYEQKMYTKPIEGKETKKSGEYCDGLALAILSGLREEASIRNPGRFSRKVASNQAFYQKIGSDPATWNNIMAEIEGRFTSINKKPFYISLNDPIMKSIRTVVPWNLKRIQAAWCPTTRRMPTDFPYTHRACVMVTNDDEIMIEDEDMTSVAYPKQRFQKPVRIGLFIYGDAPEDQDDQPVIRSGSGPPSKEDLVPDLSTEIWFENAKIPKELQSSVARLHCNLGHPPKAEIIRILAASGGLSSATLNALEALRCGSCIRLTKPVKPPTSSTATIKHHGFFGDHLQTDIIYVRILTGKAIPVLGVCCVNTNFHAATAIHDRCPETILNALKQIWYGPFGLPMSITPDADTAYMGVCQDWHVNMGIDYRMIPTEEAWKIGKIGRRNALLRSLAERLIDQHGVSTVEGLQDVLVACIFSLNSSTYSHGRSPYQAVFGRIPRPVGDLLSDSRALTITNTDHDPALRPELLRAEAITALMQISSSQAVKRALLRKTRNQNDLANLQPGQAVAYWRLQGRSRQHKKGSWCLARFLAYDPDKKHAGYRWARTPFALGSTSCDWPVDGNHGHRLLKIFNFSKMPEQEMTVDDEVFNFRPHKMTRLEEPRHDEEQILEGQSDAETSDDDLSLSNNRSMTRQEQKQLDREIPWRDIMELPKMDFDAFVGSAQKEFQGWMKWSGVVPLTSREAKRVESNPKLLKRILKSRAAYRDKARGTGALKAKTRVVIIGCGDPDLRQLSRDSPTPSRLSEFVVLAVASSGANKLFNGDNRIWHLWLSDAAQAFLQGRQDESERSGPIFMRPPRDPIQEAAGAFPAELYQVVGNCYGLSNAPRVWFNRVTEELVEHDFHIHSFDKCLFYHVGSDGLLDCVLIVHVDDFMATFSSSFDKTILEGLFEWGSVTLIDEDHSGEYRGKEIKMLKKPDGRIHYTVTQQSFLANLQEGKLKQGRLKADDLLNDEEIKEFRSVSGCIQWLGGQSRPDLASTASLCNKGSETRTSDLGRLHEALKYAKLTDTSGLIFGDVPLNRASCLVTFADSSWANAANYSSQFGVIIALCPSQVTETICNGLILDWKSGRSPRVCRSTLAAEACAADEGTDRACYINLVLTELLYQVPAWRGDMKLAMVQCTDAKSLYDCLVAQNPSVSDKRSMVQIRSVQQALRPSQIRWLPTILMVADGLTKLDVKLREMLRQWCMFPKVQLRESTSRSKTKTSESVIAQ
ncbi:unnamed protein product [Cladocopium goreaui]|uniref:Copia protein (Gag-int-pol protein) [Cleaved into: Copia VLP protein Copia protease ] n=1 Tax=Cladocopium goreaui TaxID=2562237 RepID=A0A9P1FQY3_9DINO|nr:unnamed protein product [Cladocopium goreaui]